MPSTVATGLLAWQYTGAATDVYTIPNLCNGTLIFGNQAAGATNLYQIDTLGAANAAKQGQPVTLNWTQALPGPTDGIPCYIGQPVAPDGSNAIYVVYRSAGTGASAYYVTAVNGSDGSILWTSAVQGEAFNGTLTALDCAAGQTQPPSASAPQAALFVNAGSAIYALNTTDGTTLQSYTLPTGRLTSSGISIYSNQLYVGDTAGTLYVIDGMTMTLVTNTTDAVQNTWLGVLGKPSRHPQRRPQRHDGRRLFRARRRQSLALRPQQRQPGADFHRPHRLHHSPAMTPYTACSTRRGGTGGRGRWARSLPCARTRPCRLNAPSSSNRN